jgi:hypothetical protein
MISRVYSILGPVGCGDGPLFRVSLLLFEPTLRCSASLDLVLASVFVRWLGFDIFASVLSGKDSFFTLSLGSFYLMEWLSLYLLMLSS